MLLAAGLLTLVLAGVTGIAVAQSTDGPDGPRAQAAPRAQVAQAVDDDPGATSSVTVPPDRAVTEADEGPALQSLAKITPEQAAAAAVAAVPGNATEVELENEDGNVVYKVEVTGTDGRQTDLEIDAGNRAVLSRETEAPDGPDSQDEAGETPETNEPDDSNEAPETDSD
jgi:uncharacterized membrane protein YkoI